MLLVDAIAAAITGMATMIIKTNTLHGALSARAVNFFRWLPASNAHGSVRRNASDAFLGIGLQDNVGKLCIIIHGPLAGYVPPKIPSLHHGPGEKI